MAVVRALAAGSGPGPMASSSSIDIEDATQHLRDILKLDRPGGEAPGPRGRGRPGRRAGPCPGPGLRDPPQPGPLSQAAALRGWARLPRGAGGIALRRLRGEGGPARPCPGAGGEGGVRRPGAGEQQGGPSLMAGGILVAELSGSGSDPELVAAAAGLWAPLIREVSLPRTDQRSPPPPQSSSRVRNTRAQEKGPSVLSSNLMR